MDILKMLMIYMSATLAFSVQAAPVPTVTPEPTAVVTAAPTETPEPVEEETLTPAPTEEPTATPAPTVSVTPVPVPTITPNIKGYHNLAQGAKGAEVRKLQERLIELGYLPEGSADGAYGGKTRNAVRKFQYYNGLTVDGVAGRATQTNLFENPDVAPMPTQTPVPTEEMTATPKPTEKVTLTPKPTEKVTPTPEPTKEMTPTPELTKAPTPTPEAKPESTETPETENDDKATPSPTPTATPKPTSEPTAKPTVEPTPKPTPKPTPITVEEFVDLDADGFEDIQGSVALNDNGAPLEWNALEDGVTVKKTPRLQRKEDRIRVSLDDLAECLEDWLLTEDENGTLVLEAEGYTIAIFDESEGPSATVDGVEVTMTEDDFDFLNEGRFIDSQLLARLFKGEAVWVPEEKTLMLSIPGKIRSGATD